MDDEQIELVIENVKKGDIQQFGQIVTYFQKKLFNYIYCIVNNTQDAEDILQDTFVTAFRKIYQYKYNTLFSAWLYRIARNLAYDTLKKHKRFILFERNTIENMIENSSMDMAMFQGVDEKIHDVFKQMSFAEKNILVLRIYEEKSYEEIAYITNIGQSASRKQYERARKKFIKLYNELNTKEISLEEKQFHTEVCVLNAKTHSQKLEG